jgi:hypothetical protein
MEPARPRARIDQPPILPSPNPWAAAGIRGIVPCLQPATFNLQPVTRPCRRPFPRRLGHCRRQIGTGSPAHGFRVGDGVAKGRSRNLVIFWPASEGFPRYGKLFASCCRSVHRVLSLARQGPDAIDFAFAHRPAVAGLGLGSQLFHSMETNRVPNPARGRLRRPAPARLSERVTMLPDRPVSWTAPLL